MEHAVGAVFMFGSLLQLCNSVYAVFLYIAAGLATQKPAVAACFLHRDVVASAGLPACSSVDPDAQS